MHFEEPFKRVDPALNIHNQTRRRWLAVQMWHSRCILLIANISSSRAIQRQSVIGKKGKGFSSDRVLQLNAKESWSFAKLDGKTISLATIHTLTLTCQPFLCISPQFHLKCVLLSLRWTNCINRHFEFIFISCFFRALISLFFSIWLHIAYCIHTICTVRWMTSYVYFSFEWNIGIVGVVIMFFFRSF